MGNRNRFISYSPQVGVENKLFWHYYNRLLNIALSLFTWENLPDDIDVRYLEMCLIDTGSVAFGYEPDFVDDLHSGFYVARVVQNGPLNIYQTPSKYRTVTVTDFNVELNSDNSVLGYNNFTRTPDIQDISMYAKRLTNIVETIDTNVFAQKTPVIISGTDKIRLSFLNFMDKFARNLPFIQVDKRFKTEDIQTLNIASPYVADKLTTLKKEILSEYFNFLGIDNYFSTKTERTVTGEVDSNSMSIKAEGQSRLKARQQICDKFNLLFGDLYGKEISVHYSSEFVRNIDREFTKTGGVTEIGNVYNES